MSYIDGLPSATSIGLTDLIVVDQGSSGVPGSARTVKAPVSFLPTGGSAVPIAPTTLYANPTAGTALPVSVPLNATLAFSGGNLGVVTGTSGASIPLLSTANTWGGDQTITGLVKPTGVTQSGTGNFSYSLSAAANLHLFRDGAGAIMFRAGGSPSTIGINVPMAFNPTTLALSGTWSLTGNCLLTQQNTWTGTVTSAPAGFYLNQMSHTFNLATPASTPNGCLIVSSFMGANTNNNVYTAEFTSVCAVTPAAGAAEIHGLRSSATASANMNGASSVLPAGIIIGGKFSTITTAGATFLSQTQAVEVLVQNAASPGYSMGVNIFRVGTQQAVHDDCGLSIWTNSSGTDVGFKDAILLGGSAGSPFGVSTTGTLVRATGRSLGTFTCTDGIDFTLATFSGNFLKSTGFAVDGSGNASAASYVVGASGPTITSGAGVPGSTQPKGSLYTRTSGGVGTTLYVSQGGGTWNPVAGV